MRARGWSLGRPGVTTTACKEEGCPVKPPVVGTLLIAVRGSTFPGQTCSQTLMRSTKLSQDALLAEE